MENFKFYFTVEHLKADTRSFRQDSDLLKPALVLLVEVRVPRDAQYIANLDEIGIKELSAEPAPDPILTPKGLAYVKNQLEQEFVETKPLEPEKESWTEKPFAPEAGKDEWTEPDWDENPNKPEVEVWDDEQESWE